MSCRKTLIPHKKLQKKNLFDTLPCNAKNFNKILTPFPIRKNSPFAKFGRLWGMSMPLCLRPSAYAPQSMPLCLCPCAYAPLSTPLSVCPFVYAPLSTLLCLCPCVYAPLPMPLSLCPYRRNDEIS